MLLAGLIALPLASRPLAAWAADLPDWAQPIQGGLTRWDAAMDRVGLTTPYDALHGFVRALVAQRF